ncbi:MAG: preprotein translocase subunit SecG [Planctomycetota bacterium]|nr:preprotein translocase subunit SecG [Planctomycetota bacterium]
MNWNALVLVLLILTATFLILLVLVQRGRGGGLAGALGGMGGQSAFGAKAGDTFTKITMWTAFLWIVLCIVAFRVISSSAEQEVTPPGMGAAPASGDATTTPERPAGDTGIAPEPPAQQPPAQPPAE